MKILFREYTADYSTYTFPYTVLAIFEPGDTLEAFYTKGFLPYSDHKNIPEQKIMFYMARSIRIDLEKFDLTSENRRLRKRNENLHLTFEMVPKNKIDFEEIKNFAWKYVRERIGEAMTPDRLAYIFHFPLLNHIAVFKSFNKIVGYVWIIENETLRHYWFSFFDTKLLVNGIGKHIMELMISDSRNRGQKHIYLGTCYGAKAMYKIRDFKGVEFFDGNRWNSDVKLLKNKCKSDK